MRKEVFIGYSEKTIIRDLGDTLDAWDTGDYEPVAVLAKSDRLVEIAAEGLAKGDYLIAKLGSRPGDTEGITEYEKGKGKVRVENWGQRVQ